MFEAKRALVLSPHTDDGELGCGGTVAKLLEGGAEVYFAVFSVCEQSVPDGLPKDTLEKEVRASTKALGIPESNLLLRGYPVRRLNEYRQDILEDLVQLRSRIRPDLVFMPGPQDIHQDHQVLSAEGLRAFKHSSILCYEFAWNSLTLTTTAFSKLEKRHLEQKIQALSQYQSQQGLRNYFSRQFIESAATISGVQANADYAEAFHSLRWIF